MPLPKGHTSRPDVTQLTLHGERAEGGTNLDVQQLQLLLGDGGAGRLQHQARFVAPVTQTSAQMLIKPTVSHMAIIVIKQSKTPNQTNHCVQIMVIQQSKTPNKPLCANPPVYLYMKNPTANMKVSKRINFSFETQTRISFICPL